MIGGPKEAVRALDPIFKALSPGRGAISRTRAGKKPEARRRRVSPLRAGRCRPLCEDGAQRHRIRHHGSLCGGLNILHHANVGKQDHAVDAETTPLRNPEEYQYDMNLPDIAELWRRGSVIASWLLDLTAAALIQDPALSGFAGRVSDSGEGAGLQRRRSMRLFPRQSSRRRSTSDSALAGKRTLRTRCCRPCATSSVDTWRKGQRRVDRNRPASQHIIWLQIAKKFKSEPQNIERGIMNAEGENHFNFII